MNYNNQFDFNPFYNNSSVANESQKNKGSVQLVVIFVVTIVISMMFGAGGLFIVYKINKMNAESFTIGSAMRLQDQETNGKPPNFDMHF